MLSRSLSRKLVRPASQSGITRPSVDFLNLGMNAAWINTWSGAWVFNNLMYHSELPDRSIGSGAYTYDQGLLTASVPTDKFRIKLADHELRLPPGEYTVINPDRLKVHIGGWNSPSSSASYRTDAEFTVTINAVVDTALCIHIEGSITANNGNLAVILPGQVAEWKAGNVWNKQFLDFYKAMDVKVIRAMDWTWASSNIETDWSDRVRANGISLRSGHGSGSIVPYEFMCDLAQRLSAEIWVCIPHRATPDYREQMAQLFAANYPSGKTLWLEYGNEVWNGANPWGEGTNWITYLDFTKYTATPDTANQCFILPNHGLANGTRIASFATVENRDTRITMNWRFSLGVTSYVKVLDANRFELHDTNALNLRLNVTTGMVSLLFCDTNEVGKVAKQHINFSNLCLQAWDTFDANLGANRVKRILSSQAGNLAVTTARVAVAGVKERASCLAIAPYFDGAFFGAEVTVGADQLQPKFWATGTSTAYVNVYPIGATPSLADQIDGIGAIAHQKAAYAAGGSGWTNLSLVTGLVADTQYRVMFLYVENGVHRRAEVVVTTSVGGSVVNAYPSIQDQALANKLASQVSANGIKQHAAESTLPVVCYEGGIHYHHSKPQPLVSWLDAYFESVEFADVNRRYLLDLAESGCKQYCHYGDSLGTNFCIANGYTDTEDRRYKVFTGFKGKVPRSKNGAALIIPDQVLPTVLTEPTYPHVVHTFSGPPLDYQILYGDNNANFAMVGNQLQLVNSTGIDWDSPGSLLLGISVSDGLQMRQFKVTFGLGNAWYEGDAVFAWSPLDEPDTAAITPRIGNVLPRLNGTGPTVEADGLWNFGGANRYGSSSGTISAITANKPTLWAAVIETVLPFEYYKFLWKHGTGNFMAQYLNNARLETYSWMNGSSPALTFAPGDLTGKHVVWMFYDPLTKTFTSGVDQNEVMSASRDWLTVSFNPSLHIGGSDSGAGASKMKHGAMQILNRAGMTKSDILSIVMKMQEHHNIA